MTMQRPRRRRRWTWALLAVAILLAACGGGAGGGSGSDPEAFSVLSANENQTLRPQLDALAQKQCADENEALPLEHQTVAQSDVVRQVTQLASQDALPTHFIAGTDQVRPDGDLGASERVLDYEQPMKDLGVWDQVLPVAEQTIKDVYGGMVSLPYEYNIEGIWYNKDIFAEHGLDEPKTWQELMSASAELQDVGVIPMAQAGSDGWNLTRLIGMHIFRNVGPKAMEAVRDGEAKLTDSDYVEGAAAVEQMADEGYFGEGVVSREASVSTNLFLTGESAMRYAGSSLLRQINDDEQNVIGSDSIGLMPFPTVEGGTGSIDQWPGNANVAMAMSPEQYGPQVGDWLECIASNYGAQALEDAGAVSGFQVDANEVDGEVPPLTQVVQERLEEIDEPVLWFEAHFDQETNALAADNVSLLVTGQLSAVDYMAQLQQSIDDAR